MVLNRRSKRGKLPENVGEYWPMRSVLITASWSEKWAGHAWGYARGQLATGLLAALAHTAVSIHYDDLIGRLHVTAVATSGSFINPAIASRSAARVSVPSS